MPFIVVINAISFYARGNADVKALVLFYFFVSAVLSFSTVSPTETLIPPLYSLQLHVYTIEETP